MQHQLELNYSKAAQWASNGQTAAVMNADSHCPGWSDDAFLWLWEFARMNRGSQFMAEVVRKYAHDHGLPMPESSRAWGAVFTRAAKQGIIRAVGYGKTTNPLAHSTPATLWEAE